MKSNPPEDRAASIVLDTNAVLDWLVFADARMHAAAGAITEGRLRWIVVQRMRDELAAVLVRPALAVRHGGAAGVLAQFDRWSQTVATPAASPVDRRLVSRDADDQIFIDLALMHRARLLLTHDRALLCLAARARPHGVAILRPQEAGPACCIRWAAADRAR